MFLRTSRFCRVLWTKRSENIAKRGGVSYYGDALPPGTIPETIPEGDEENEEESAINGETTEERAQGDVNEEDEDEDESDDDDNEDDHENPTTDTHDGTKGEDGDTDTSMLNSCDLLWQGIVPRRLFHGFRFQVFSSNTVTYFPVRNAVQQVLLGKC